MSNLNYNEPGAGSGVKAVATETISSTEYQQLKIVDGTATSTNPVAAKAFGHQDANAAGATVFGLVVAALNQLWNGAADTFDRWRSASAANLLNKNSVGAATVAGPGQWAVTHAPTVNTAAVASKTAGGAGVSHICTGVAITIGQDTTGGTPFQGLCNLRDGGTGAGTILASFNMSCITTPGDCRTLVAQGLNIPGTANTAMTLEFAAAGGAHTYESCTLFGYDAQ